MNEWYINTYGYVLSREELMSLLVGEGYATVDLAELDTDDLRELFWLNHCEE